MTDFANRNNSRSFAFAPVERPGARSGKILHQGTALDASGSMETPYSDRYTRWEALVSGYIEMLRSMKENRRMARCARLFLLVFNSELTWLLEGEPLKDIDLDSLRARLLAIEPCGVTRMGDAVVALTNRLREAHSADDSNGSHVVGQPIEVLYSDGEPTDLLGFRKPETMGPAYSLVDDLLSRRKLLLLPVGIGSESSTENDFPSLTRLIEKDPTISKPLLISSEADIAASFRLIEKTVTTEMVGGNNSAEQIEQIRKELEAQRSKNIADRRAAARERYGYSANN